MYSIGFDENNKIIVATFSGSLNKIEPLKYIESLLAIKNLPENLKILQDFTNTNYDLNVGDLEDIAVQIKKHFERFKSIKVAAIHNKSAETAISIIFAKLLESENLNYLVFSTEEAAIKWLEN